MKARYVFGAMALTIVSGVVARVAYDYGRKEAEKDAYEAVQGVADMVNAEVYEDAEETAAAAKDLFTENGRLKLTQKQLRKHRNTARIFQLVGYGIPAMAFNLMCTGHVKFVDAAEARRLDSIQKVVDNVVMPVADDLCRTYRHLSDKANVLNTVQQVSSNSTDIANAQTGIDMVNYAKEMLRDGALAKLEEKGVVVWKSV